MADTEQPQGAPAAVYAPAKSGHKVLLTFLVFVLALAAFAAAVYYSGGVDYLTSLLGGTSSGAGSGASGSNAAAAPATPTVSATDIESAKLAYAEQIESQANIDRLADGDIKSFRVDSVQAGADSAVVNITASFKDGTSALGGLRFVKNGQLWYFATISGLRQTTTNGTAEGVGTGTSIAPVISADKKLAQVGVVTPDAGVLKTIAEQQIVNQPVIRDLLAGEYKSYELGKPVAGPSTFTIPVTISGTTETAIPASIVIIAKNVESKDRLFITTFKRE